MLAVLASIQPRHCCNIITEEKLIEVRKSVPKIGVPFKVYIYCTKGADLPICGKVIGEFVCKDVKPISVYYSDILFSEGKKTFPFTCLTDREIINYLGNGKEGYGWCVSDLVVYDKPKELSDFIKPYAFERLQSAPQSWCYVQLMDWKINQEYEQFKARLKSKFETVN